MRQKRRDAPDTSFSSPGTSSLTIERLELDTGSAGQSIEVNSVFTISQRFDFPMAKSLASKHWFRWQNSKRGLLSPGEFIPEAEDLGLLSSIGSWVLREACEEATRWPALTSDGKPLSVGVNPFSRRIPQA